MSDRGHLRKAPPDFAETHCRQCEFGWTRRGRSGAFTACLLDRKPVMAGMSDCDRYELRGESTPDSI